MKNGLALIVVILLSGSGLKAQDDFEGFLEAGIDDANTLLEGYLAPALESIGTGLGNGWYNTAATHKTGGVDISVSASAVFIPDASLFYTPNLTTTTLLPSGPDRAPTILGPDDDASLPIYEYNFTDDAGQNFSGEFKGIGGANIAENGIGMQAVPIPMVNLGIGLIKNTDLKIRWTPKIDIDGNSSAKLIGFAIMHDIKQYIPGLKERKFALSALVGFTDISASTSFDTQASSSGGVTTNNGMASFDVNTWTVQGLISRRFSVLTLYGGLGFNTSKSNISLDGDFVVSDNNGETSNYSNPLDLNFGVGGPRVTAGMRLRLLFLTINADYTLQKYNTLTVGVGFSFAENKN